MQMMVLNDVQMAIVNPYFHNQSYMGGVFTLKQYLKECAVSTCLTIFLDRATSIFSFYVIPSFLMFSYEFNNYPIQYMHYNFFFLFMKHMFD